MWTATKTLRRQMFVTADGRNVLLPFILVSSLFLLWGLCNGMIDVMDKHFQDELGLSKSQSAWVQFAHYLGYFLMSLPAGWLAIKLGYKGGIIVGLLVVAAGGLWFIPATHINTLVHEGRVSSSTAFVAYLAGVCMIAIGLTFLETIANPYTTVLGHKHFAAIRINLAQSCNGIGWIFGPIIGSIFFYSKDARGRSTGSQTLYIPYAAIAIVGILLAVIFYLATLPDIKGEDAANSSTVNGARNSIWKETHFVCAVGAQFFYVAAQAGIFSFFINYMTTEVPAIPSSWNTAMVDVSSRLGLLREWLLGWFILRANGMLSVSDKGASNLAAAGFVLFLLGRFTGSILLRTFSAHNLLSLYAMINVLLTGLIFLKLGWLSVACLFLSYFFMSIMFPTIFALGLFGLGPRAKQASGFIVMAIMGGAILPKLMGALADKWDMSRGFIVPMFCFAFVAAYGWYWPRLCTPEQSEGAAVTVTSVH